MDCTASAPTSALRPPAPGVRLLAGAGRSTGPSESADRPWRTTSQPFSQPDLMWNYWKKVLPLRPSIMKTVAARLRFARGSSADRHLQIRGRPPPGLITAREDKCAGLPGPLNQDILRRKWLDDDPFLARELSFQRAVTTQVSDQSGSVLGKSGRLRSGGRCPWTARIAQRTRTAWGIDGVFQPSAATRRLAEKAGISGQQIAIPVWRKTDATWQIRTASARTMVQEKQHRRRLQRTHCATMRWRSDPVHWLSIPVTMTAPCSLSFRANSDRYVRSIHPDMYTNCGRNPSAT